MIDKHRSIKKTLYFENFQNQTRRLLVHIHGDGAALLLQGAAQGGGEGERQGVQRVKAVSCQLSWHHLHDRGGASHSLLWASSMRSTHICNGKIINFQITATIVRIVRKYVHIHALEILLNNGISFLKDCQENAGCFLDEVSFHYQ